MARYRATVAYDGTRYKGFQIQTDSLTIQGEIERALRDVTRHSVRIAGSGRTDTGVHAQGQVISFGCDWRHGTLVLERAMNAKLPDDIAVSGLCEADEGFHARFCAIRRTYVYNVLVAPHPQPLLERYALRLSASPRLELMRGACEHLVGERDFSAMGQSPSGGSTVRRIDQARWLWVAPETTATSASECWPQLRLVVSANGFLRGMVRRIVGAMLEVGVKRMTPGAFGELIAGCDIAQSPPPAPAHGLVLWRVEYDTK